MRKTMKAISVSHLTKIYQGQSSAEKALNNISLDFNFGEKVLLSGKSGSGKSTLLKIISGAEDPTYGTLEVADPPLYIGSDVWILEDWSVYDNVYFWALGRLKDRRASRKAAMKAIDDVGLRNKRRTKAKRLSGGERNRLGVARAIALCPSIVLCDELTANLDQESAEKMISLILDRMPDSTIVFASHDPSSFPIATRKITMSEGIIESDSSPLAENISVEISTQSKCALGFGFGLKSVWKRKTYAALLALFSLAIGAGSGLSLLISESELSPSSSAKINYYYGGHFANRLVSGGYSPFENASYLDAGSMLSEETFTLALSGRLGGGYVLARDSYVQPVYPSDGELCVGKKDETGFYLCVSTGIGNDEINRYKDYLGKEFQFFHSSQYSLSNPVSETLVFSGVYLIGQQSFFNGPSRYIYLPNESLKTIDGYVKSLLDRSLALEIEPIHLTGLRGYDGSVLSVEGKKATRLSFSDAEKRLGEQSEFLERLFLSADVEGKDCALQILSSEIPLSALNNVTYVNELLPGEWFLSEQAFKKTLIEWNVCSSAFYDSASKMSLDSYSFAVEKGDAHSSSAEEDGFPKAICALISIFVALTMYFLGVGVTTLERRRLEFIFDLATYAGFGRLSLKIPLSLICVVFSVVGYVAASILYGGLMRISPGIIVSVVSVIALAFSLPLWRKKR